MKKSLIILLTATLGLAVNKSKAQVSTYSFNQFTGSYGSTNTGTMIGSPIQDDDINQVSLPFTFMYNGNPYNSIDVSSNGFIGFGSQPLNSYAPISTIAADLISPFGQDLFMGKVTTGDITTGSNTITNVSSVANIQVGDSIFDFMNDFGGQNPVITSIVGNSFVLNLNATNTNVGNDLFIFNGSLKHNVTGTSPNRIFEIEYRNFSRFAVYDETINFKVKLYETSNIIEFIYGTMVPGTISLTTEVGIRSVLNSDFNSRLVNSSNNWSTSLPSTLITDGCDFDNTQYPAYGLTYQFSPSTCAQPTLVASQSNSVLCVGQTVTLTVSGADSYTWSTGAISNSIIVSPTATTVYSISGTYSNCATISTVSIQQTVSNCTIIKQIDSESIAVEVYPNPFQSKLTIKNNSSFDCKYSVVNVLGSIVFEGVLINGDNIVTELDKLNSGIYFVKITNGKNTLTKRIVKN